MTGTTTPLCAFGLSVRATISSMRVMGRSWYSLLICVLALNIGFEAVHSFVSPLMFLARTQLPTLASLGNRSTMKKTASSLCSSRLHEIAEGLVSDNTKHDENGSFHACLVVAGGGGQAISALSSTPGASSLLLEGAVTYHRNSFFSYLGNARSKSDDSFVSEEMAKELSRAALDRALSYAPSVGSYKKCVGVACTSALLKPNGRKGRMSRGHICATSMDGGQWSCNVVLSEGRSRHEEDALMSCVVLEGMQQFLFPRPTPDEFDYLKKTAGDEAQVSLKCISSRANEESVISSARQILSKETHAALLVPLQSVFVQAPKVILPPRQPTLIFPGSFNPPHRGHLALAQVAIDMIQQQSDGDASILMEVSLTNADKPPIPPEEVSRRAHLFFELEENLLPNSWGILLTSAPLFQQKVQLIRDAGNTGELVFVIGTDTMVRIINPKYYGNSLDNMLTAVRDMKQLGVSYVVGGRLEQGMDTQGAFVTGHEELQSLPEDIQDMFMLVREEDFRMDISSTELRRQANRLSAS